MKSNVKESVTQRKHVDLLGIDFATSATKVVRLKKSKEEFELIGIDLLPPVNFKESSKHFDIPREYRSNYASLAYTAPAAIVRVLNTQLPPEEKTLSDNKLRELLNVDEDFRTSAFLLKKGKGRQDSNFLAVAIPDADIDFHLSMFPAGPPAPASLEVSGLALLPAFMHARGEECAEEAVCLIEAGELISHFAFIVKGTVVLVGKYAFGSSVLREKVAKDLGLDDELAANILMDPSINISTTVMDQMAPFLKQLNISKDFIQRHQNCRVGKVYVSGGLALLPNLTPIVESLLHAQVELWSPFENIECAAGIIPEHLAGQLTRFAAATGAAIGGLE